MTHKEVINKAYGHIPKEIGVFIDLSWVPSFKVKRLLVKIRRLFRKN